VVPLGIVRGPPMDAITITSLPSLE
jgi:hypothetical protein